MYSGSDSIESQNYTQWALNPSAYQNMSNDQVDWAALAHQWIIMKETGPPIPEQVAPPAPIISRGKKELITEGGEAPMDVENDEDNGKKWNESGSNDSWTSWNQSSVSQQAPWSWNNSWSAPSGVPAPSSVKTPLLPTPAYNSYGSGKEPPVDNNFSYNVPPSGGDYHSSGYWNSASSSKVIKPHNKRYSKVNVPVPTSKVPVVTLDAAKRKTLPAWIREGLEKMERDKVKHLDRVKENPEKFEIENKGKLRENAMEILKSTVQEIEKQEFTTYEDSDDDTDGNPLSSSTSRSPTPLTYEEKMLKVRRTMTEILLKVTNREIQSICREELQRHVRKLKASDQHVSAPSGANLIAKLGLGAYEGSGDSSSGSDNEESNQWYHDSDSELRDVIRRRKEEFSKTERDIEHRLAEAERYDSRAGTPDSDIVSQVDAKGQDRKSRRSEELTPPPKFPHISKSSHKRQSSPSTLSDSDTDKNSKSSKKSKDRGSRDIRSSSNEKRRMFEHSRSKTPKSKRNIDSSRSRSKRSRSTSRKRAVKKRSKHSRSRSRSVDTFRRSRSRSSRRRNRSRSRRRSDSKDSYHRKRSRSRSRDSRSSRRYRRSRSYSSGRGKRSYRQ